MKRLLFIILAGCSCTASAQTIRSVWVKTEFYNRISANPDNRATYNELEKIRLLDMHLFNLSYAQGIEGFLEFKYKFHYSTGKSDIPEQQAPIDYLLAVLEKYNRPGYKVAFLYYDAVSDEEIGKSKTTEYGNWLYAKGKHQKQNSTETVGKDRMRVWYLSDEHLHKEQTNYSYEQLQELEWLNRRQLGVNAIGAARAPRGGEVEKDTAFKKTTFSLEDAGKELQQCLLPPNVLQLMETDKINALIIVPYGVTGQIPYYSLQLDSANYFVDRYAYTIAPHPCNFRKVFGANPGKIGQTHSLQPKRSLVVGNPKFHSRPGLKLPDLPGAKREADSVALKLGTVALTGMAANYDTISARLKNSEFVYFATHAVPSFKDPVNESFIALTPSASNRTGYLNIKTIQDISKRETKLVVLSACQTGVGKAYKNGYCNIGRGFFIAGVDNTIMSLWNLDDENIVPFMTTLTTELQKEQPFYPAENLRQAILKFKKPASPKAHWSAMVNFGICY